MKARDPHILALVRAGFDRAGYRYPTVTGKTFLWLRRIALWVWPLGLVFIPAMLVGQYLYAAGGNEAAVDVARFWKWDYAPYYLACFAVGLAGYIALVARKPLLSGLASLASTVALFIPLLTYGRPGCMIGTDFTAGINPDFWLYHGLPMGIPCLCVLSLCYIFFRQYTTEGKAYKKVCARAYEQFGRTDLPPEEWDAFLAHYDPRRNTYEGYVPVFNENETRKDP